MPVINDLYYFLHPGGKSSAPPVILVHGAGASHLIWPPELRRLSTQRVLSVDLPGHGRSGGVGLHTARDYAMALVDFLTANQIWKAVFIGHGLGAAVALTLALEAPERATGLALLSCGLRLPVNAALLESAANPATHHQAYERLLAGAFSPQAEKHVREGAARLLAQTRPAVLYGDLLACSSFDVSQALQKLRLPTLILCGTEDSLTPLKLVRSLSNAIPEAAFQTVDGAGHMVMLEQPRRVSALMSVFIQTIPHLPGQ